MGKKSAPKPPDPYKTALMQSKMNESNATYNQLANMVNQVGPDGGLTYSQSGAYDYLDPVTGKMKKVPRYTATQSLSDAQQKIKGQVDAGRFNLASLLNTMSGKLGDTLGTPLDLSSENVKRYMNTHFMDDFDSDWKRQESDLDGKLAGKGIVEGSDAHTRAIADFAKNRSNARDNLYGNQYSTALNALLTERREPQSEIAALISNTPVSQQNLINTPGGSAAGTDFGALAMGGYQAQLDAWKAKQAQAGAIGGMFGDIGAALAGNTELMAMLPMLSDRRAKENIKKVGKTDDGQNIYAYRYKGGGRAMHLGLMAQEVEKRTPEAVVTLPSGLKAVDYSRALHLGAS